MKSLEKILIVAKGVKASVEQESEAWLGFYKNIHCFSKIVSEVRFRSSVVFQWQEEVKKSDVDWCGSLLSSWLSLSTATRLWRLGSGVGLAAALAEMGTAEERYLQLCWLPEYQKSF